MHRLFVAIRPPGHIREQLLDLMEGVRGARWQSEDQLHLTLRFIGEVDRHGGADIAAALGAVRHPAFEIAVEGIGSFDRRGRPEVIWAGLAPQEPLKALHKKIDQAVQRAGLPPEHRAYHPHITLARLKPGVGPIDPLASRAVSSKPFLVEGFALYESTLAPEGAAYTLVERYPLQAPTAESNRSNNPE